MKPLAILLFSFLLAEKLFGERSIVIGKDTFILAYSEENKNGRLQEFVRPSENLESWTELIGVRIFQSLDSPKQYIENMAAEYRKRFPLNQFAVFENKETKAWMIDYIIFPPEMDKGIIEWNYFVAVKSPSGTGITVNQFAARRAVVGTVKQTMKAWSLGTYRNSMLPVLMQSRFSIEENSNTGHSQGQK